jgi:tetratricopeptide (TPR) repeat protein
MLETVREYAQHRLDEAGETTATRERHLAYFVEFAETAHSNLGGPDQRRWLALCDSERENIAVAHAWCAHAAHGGELDLRLVRAIRKYCYKRGQLAMGLTATLDALARPGAQARNAARCRALSDAGQMAMRMGRRDEALAYMEESLAIAREVGDKARIEEVLQPLALALADGGDLAGAQAHLEEALVLARELGNRREVAAALSALTQVHRIAGAFDAAVDACEQSLALAREVADREELALILLNRAMLALQRKRGEPVAPILVEAHRIIEDAGAISAGQYLLDVATGLAASRDEWPRAARYFGAAEALAEQSEMRRDTADAAFLDPFVAASRAALGPEAFARHAGDGREQGYGEVMRDASAWLASLCEPAPG